MMVPAWCCLTLCTALLLPACLAGGGRILRQALADDPPVANVTELTEPVYSLDGNATTSRAAQPLGSFFPTTYAAWMKNISDDRLISDISMPGTHDTMAYQGNWDLYGRTSTAGYAQTQQQTLWEQLKGGVRFLDIHLRQHGTDLYCLHNDYFFYNHFGYVVETVRDFLLAYPSEAILMSIKKDTDQDPVGTFSSHVAWTLRWWGTSGGPNTFIWTSPETPTMGQARGKLFLVLRFDVSASDEPGDKAVFDGALMLAQGWQWGASLFDVPLVNRTVWVQDGYETGEREKRSCISELIRKKEQVEELLTRAMSKRPQDFYLNYANVPNYGTCFNDAQASLMNKWLESRVGEVNYRHDVVGVLVLDYAWQYLVLRGRIITRSAQLIPSIIQNQHRVTAV